jgi:hypothetical protein
MAKSSLLSDVARTPISPAPVGAPIWKASNLGRKPFWPPTNLRLVHRRAGIEDETREVRKEER